MSDDRKPGRARVLQASDETPGRRRHDGPPIILDAAGMARARKAARKSQLVMIMLFLITSGGVAAAVELYVPV